MNQCLKYFSIIPVSVARLLLINKNLMLEYGGGAIVPQCFPKEN